MSKAQRNVLATIGLAGALPEIMKQKYGNNPPKSVVALTNRINDAFMEAAKTWPGCTDVKNLERIALRLKRFENEFIAESKEIDLVAYMSMTIGLIDDITTILKDKRRIGVLKKLERAVNCLLRYYDRNLDKWSLYDQANTMIRGWQMMEA